MARGHESEKTSDEEKERGNKIEKKIKRTLQFDTNLRKKKLKENTDRGERTIKIVG